jgi:hypothetical protein
VSHTPRIQPTYTNVSHRSAVKDHDAIGWPKFPPRSPVSGPKASPKKDKSAQETVQASFPGFRNAFQNPKHPITTKVVGVKLKIPQSSSPVKALFASSPDRLYDNASPVAHESPNSPKPGYTYGDTCEAIFDLDKQSLEAVSLQLILCHCVIMRLNSCTVFYYHNAPRRRLK